MRIARPPRRRNTIVLTSLVDVLFVLLFFFMLVTRYGDWRAWSVALSGGGDSALQANAVTVQVRGDDHLFIDDEPATIDAIANRLSAPGARAVLVAAPGVSLQSLIDVLDRLKPTGAALTLGRAAPPP